jgi:AraC family transcriptional regulator
VLAYIVALVQLEREAARSQPSLPLIKAVLTTLLVRCARAMPRREHRGHDDLVVQQLREMVEQTIAMGQVISVAAMANRAGLSADHLTRRFRAAAGETPSTYARRRRMQYAAARLLETDASVTQVACALGFADAAHLSRASTRDPIDTCSQPDRCPEYPTEHR